MRNVPPGPSVPLRAFAPQPKSSRLRRHGGCPILAAPRIRSSEHTTAFTSTELTGSAKRCELQWCPISQAAVRAIRVECRDSESRTLVSANLARQKPRGAHPSYRFADHELWTYLMSRTRCF